MKQLLLLFVIHLMVFHQYSKDKKEELSPKNYKPVNRAEPSYNQFYLINGIEIYGIDSFRVSDQPKSLAYDFINYRYLIK